MSALMEAVASWQLFVVSLLVFGFAPGAFLRIIVLAFAKDDPRRHELIAELYAVPRIERPYWVLQQLEVALFEGIVERVVWAATGRIIRRWHLASAVERNRLYPETFEIPSEPERASVQPGDVVKLMFEMSDWGERMWVRVVEVRRRHIVGVLANQPVGIPRLWHGDTIKFQADHILDIDLDDHEPVDGREIEWACPRCSGCEREHSEEGASPSDAEGPPDVT